MLAKHMRDEQCYDVLQRCFPRARAKLVDIHNMLCKLKEWGFVSQPAKPNWKQIYRNDKGQGTSRDYRQSFDDTTRRENYPRRSEIRNPSTLYFESELKEGC